MVITTAQFHSTKPELRFCAGSNPAGGVSEIRDGEDLWQWSQLEIRLNAFRQSTIPQNNSSSSSSSSSLSSSSSSLTSFSIQSAALVHSETKLRLNFTNWCYLLPPDMIMRMFNCGRFVQRLLLPFVFPLNTRQITSHNYQLIVGVIGF